MSDDIHNDALAKAEAATVVLNQVSHEWCPACTIDVLRTALAAAIAILPAPNRDRALGIVLSELAPAVDRGVAAVEKRRDPIGATQGNA